MRAEQGIVWITGASSGIGRALARELARTGYHVAASARSGDRLDEVAGESDGRISCYPLDVTDLAASAATIAAIENDLGPIDLAVLCAGTWKPFTAGGWKAVDFAGSMDVNYTGVSNAVAELVPRMIERGRGRLALVSSVAGYYGLPAAAAYGPTKAALINLAECLRIELAGTGVEVTLINPGFVDTPMTRRNTFPMPFLMTPETAARRIARGLERGRFEIAFPRRLVWLMKAVRLMPYPLYFRIMRAMVCR
jgi:short-subunit dehydrogenase